MAQTILLTDASPVARRILSRVLAPLGADVVEAEGAEDALKVLRRVAVDLVVADADLPGLDGVSLVAAAREHLAGSDRSVPFILLTASHRPGREHAALRAGAGALLSKPVDAASLLDAARRLLGRPAERAAAAV